MTIFKMIEVAYEKGKEDIQITIDQFNELLSNIRNSGYDTFKDGGLDFIADRAVLLTRHFATYKDTLNIWVFKKGQ
jgi:hypothetical protein